MPVGDLFTPGSALNTLSEIMREDSINFDDINTMLEQVHGGVASAALSAGDTPLTAQDILAQLNAEDSPTEPLTATAVSMAVDVARGLMNGDIDLSPESLLSEDSPLLEAAKRGAEAFGIDGERVDGVASTAQSLLSEFNNGNLSPADVFTEGTALNGLAMQGVRAAGFSPEQAEAISSTISSLAQSAQIIAEHSGDFHSLDDVLSPNSPVRQELMRQFDASTASKAELLDAEIAMQSERLALSRSQTDKVVASEWDDLDTPLSKNTMTQQEANNLESDGWDTVHEFSFDVAPAELSPKERATVAASFGSSLADSVLEIRQNISQSYGPKTEHEFAREERIALKTTGPRTKEETKSIQDFADGITDAASYLASRAVAAQNTQTERSAAAQKREASRLAEDEQNQGTGMFASIKRGLTNASRTIGDGIRSAGESIADTASSVRTAIGTISELGFGNAMKLAKAANGVANDAIAAERHADKLDKRFERSNQPEPTGMWEKFKAKVSAVGEKIGDAIERINPHLFNKMEKAQRLSDFVMESIDTMDTAKDKPEVGAAIVASKLEVATRDPAVRGAALGVQELMAENPHLISALRVSANRKIDELQQNNPEVKELAEATKTALNDPNAANLTKVGTLLADPETQTKLKDSLQKTNPDALKAIENGQQSDLARELSSSFDGQEFNSLAAAAAKAFQNPNAETLGDLGAAATSNELQGRAKKVLRAASPEALEQVEGIQRQASDLIDVAKSAGVEEVAKAAMEVVQSPEAMSAFSAAAKFAAKPDLDTAMEAAGTAMASKEALTERGAKVAMDASSALDKILASGNGERASSASASVEEASRQAPKQQVVREKEVAEQAKATAAQAKPREMASASVGR